MPLERQGDARRRACIAWTALAATLALGALWQEHAQAQISAPELDVLQTVAEPEASATSLHLDAPPECSSLDTLDAEIRRLVGTTGELVVPGARAVWVAIDRVEGGFVVELRSEGDDGADAGTRVLSDSSCEALAEAAALIIAMMIDPDAALLSAASTPDPAPAPPAPIDRRSTDGALGLDAPLGVRVRSTPRGPPPIGVGLGAVLDVGLTPSAAGGVFVEAVVRIDSFDLRASVTYLAPSAARPNGGAGADVSGVLGAVHGCGRPLRDPWLGICLGVHVGALLAVPVGIVLPAPGTPAGGVVAASLGLTLPWVPIDELDLEIAAEVLVSLVRPRFEVEPSPGASGPPTVVHEPLPAGVRIRLGVHFDLRP